MKRALTILIITFASAVVPMLAWYTFDALVLGNCDPKFGCLGGIQFGAFIVGVSAFVSSLSVLAAYIAVNKAVSLEFTNATIATTAAIGLVLGILTRIVLPNLAESIISMVIIWLAMSFFIGIAAYLTQRNISNHSSTPLRGRTS
jgi:hypothetical protein